MFHTSFSKSSTRISPKEAKLRLEAESGIVLLDVRTPDEHSEKRIPGSINVPLDSLSGIDSIIPQKDTPIFVYCLSGGRSSAAAGLLNRMGYTNIFNLGGIMGWPYQTISG